MTNHVTDLANSDVILIMGGNPAENHPVAFKWVARAMEKGAKLIVVDPRFTRSAAAAHIYAPMRSGTDIAFLGGMVNYIFENKLYQEEYIREYTNAAFLINPSFGFADGVFSGWDSAKRTYDKSSWAYQLDDQGIPKRDPTMTDPNSVFQLLRKHYSRYTLDAVSAVTGTPKETLEAVYKTFAETGKPDKAGAFVYAMGQTQHTVGTQNVESMAVVQLLLGNIGIAGGQIAAMRGLHNVQGATDFAALFHNLPGYLAVPTNRDATLADYLKRVTPTTKDPKSLNWWKNYPKYITSLLKAWFGAAATKENDYGFNWLPKIMTGKDYSHIPLFEAMRAGEIKGFVVIGQNPAVGGPNSNLERQAMDKLEWLVVADLWETETAAFWKRPGAKSADIKTEVFLLPAGSWVEREGSVTNTGRWAQWRNKAIDPVGDSKPDLWLVNQIMRRVRALYAKEGGTEPDPVAKLDWDYGDGLPDAKAIAKEINGRATVDVKDAQGTVVVAAGKQVPGFASLQDDGSTLCGNWLYSAYFTEAGNMAARRDPADPTGLHLYSNWAWNWPVNRRILYNRASVKPDGTPWDPKRVPVKWDADKKAWSGDVIDGGGAPGAIYPFIMVTEGVGRIFCAPLAEGPFPEHYEAWESPVSNLLSKQQTNPLAKIWESDLNRRGEVAKYPIIGTTYRLSEHMQAGAMSRNLPWLVELQPEPFVEISEELAAEKGIKNGDRVAVETTRGKVEMVAVVTKRMKPFRVNGRAVHEVGLVWHWGYEGLSKGDSGNLLTPHVGDANTTMPEYKAFLCDVRKVV
jgi:formate dehydrogenase major subunit